MFLTLAVVIHHIGAFVHFRTGWGPAVEQQAAWNMIWSFNLAYVCFAFATWLYSKLSRVDIIKLVKQYYAIPITIPRSQGALLIPAIILFAIGLVGAAFLLGGKLHIIDVVRVFATGQWAGAKEVAYEARKFMGSEEYRGQGYFEQMRSAVLPMIMIIWLIVARVTRQRLYWWLAAIGGAAITLTMVAGLQRGVLMLFIMQIMVVMMVVYNVRPNMRWLYGAFHIVAVFFGLSILLGRGRMSEDLVENIILKWEGVVNRLYLTNSLSTAKCFELFPKYEDFRYGMTWVNDIIHLAPGQQGLSLSHEVYAYIWGGRGGGGVHFVAEMWANGGFGMVAVASFLVGLFLYWVNLQLLSIKVRTPLTVTYIGLIAFCLGTLGLTGFTAPFSHGIIAIAILYWMFKLFQGINSRLNIAEEVAMAKRSLPTPKTQDSPA